ncbi:nitrate- and nitrite sensing domain-containing protein [Streptomyces sp. RB6PN25]|uniref:histidine kinase n=1 Tax=Streptomyces humicola TaxID=2953240 RepID=A0ABT1Q4S8_9ACTN|nr:nitrate- and nitrite sensing domain-containing protein [Streptomyces humicola]MCQ4084928.1 nitrate- and nitrite sensing domain-containing protein [Streptomyces humicola]
MQGRFKRDGGAAGDPESRGGSGRGPEPRRPADDTVNAGPAQVGNGGASTADAPARTTAHTTSGTHTTGGDVEAPPPVRDNASGKHASRVAMRNWSIRTRLVSLVALPVVAATTLGALRIQTELDNVSQLDNMKLLTDMTGHATKLADALQTERDSSAGPIASGHANDDQVVASRQSTDEQIQGFNNATETINGNDPTLVGVRSTIIDIDRQLQSLKQIRATAYTNPQYISQTVSGYDQLINSLLALSQDMAQATSNPDIIRSTRALAAFTSAKEYESMQRAVISAALANPSGPTLSQSDRLFAQTASDSESAEMQRFSVIYGPGAAALTKALDGGNTVITQADQYRDRVLKTQNALSQNPMSYLDFYDQADTKIQEMSRIEQELLDQMSQQALTLRSQAQQDALLNGAVILLVLGISLVGAFVVARSMIRSLRRLQDTAKDVAQKRLPELVKQLSEADPQDVDTSVESIGISTRDEIGQVARAFDEVHREAVRLAAEQALLRGNVNAMFTNLSRRSQGLIQRQLSLISELESREADPDQLSNLFKLDHLATRMRRNGENLLVLAGEEPGRRWTRPVPLVDVLRAAASEVEQYERIELAAVPPTEVAGRVVNDLVHLLAELLENATSFSSPQTKVRVTGHALPDGRVLIEIHDTGIGLSPEDLSDINERLANPPTVDVSVSRRMGLFVVGRLSLRHGIRIQLRPSDSGGTTALVMLPVDLTQGGGKGPAAGGQGTGRRGGPTGAPGTAPGAAASSASQLGRVPQRGQVPSAGRRPALTGGADGSDLPAAAASSASSAQDGGQVPQISRTGAGLPTRQGAPSPQQPAPQQPQQPSERPAPSWAQQDRSGQDVPRGHDDVESTSRFPRSDFGAGQNAGRDDDPSSTAQIPVIPGTGAGRGPAPAGPSGQHDRFGGAPYADGSDGESTGEYRAPQTGQLPQAGEFRGPIGAGSGSDVFGTPNRRPSREGRGPLGPAGPASPAAPGGAIPRPGSRDERPVRPAQQRPEAQLPPAAEPMALPPASSPGDGRSPIYESLESDWFRGAEGDAPSRRQPRQPSRPQPARPQQAQSPQGPAPQGPAPQQPMQQRRVRAAADGTDRTQPLPQAQPQDWRSSPNDEGWRRAEQIREPAAGGITSSGLPRRVPRANLVPGTAQQTSQSGPQVSRAPDDVRGRLTNLRRGIQQGRSAGSGNTGQTDIRGFGTPHQQER